MESWPFFLVCVVVTPRLVCGAETLCAKVIGGSSCQCQTPSGLVDLSPLSNADCSGRKVRSGIKLTESLVILYYAIEIHIL